MELFDLLLSVGKLRLHIGMIFGDPTQEREQEQEQPPMPMPHLEPLDPLVADEDEAEDRMGFR